MLLYLVTDLKRLVDTNGDFDGNILDVKVDNDNANV